MPIPPTSLAVIGAGFGRTGTLSLKLALEQLLGGPCYHMKVIIEEHPEHIPLWRDAAAGRPVDWPALYQGFRSSVDWPAATFYKELMEAFPDARVILTVRDKERWYDSAFETIWQAGLMMAKPPMSWMTRLIGRHEGMIMADEVVWQRHFGGRFADRAVALAEFDRHVAEVKATVPPERLLVYEVKQGWGPLCAFLGVDAPEGPFPHVNDTAEIRRMFGIMKATAWGMVLIPPALLLGLLYWLAS